MVQDLTTFLPLHPLIYKLATSIVSCWRKKLYLAPYKLPKDLNYIESLLGTDKLTIQNFCYQSHQFRKIHLELVRFEQKLDILHCVMFPRFKYSLPIFGCDLVIGKNKISAAVVDLSPTNPKIELSREYKEKLSQLKPYDFLMTRNLPEWGDIFSEYCLFIQPINLEEENKFLQQVEDILQIHCKQSTNSKIVSDFERNLNLQGQEYYCYKQKQNDKTRRILENFFGVNWANKYISQVLFSINN